MTRVVFSEFMGGRVLGVEDLEPSSLDQQGGATLDRPAGTAQQDDGSVLVADMGAHALAWCEQGGPWHRLGTRGSGDLELERPAGTAFLPSGQLLVVDAGNGRLVAVDDISGAGWTTYGERGVAPPGDPGEGLFVDPRGVAVDTSGRIWVTDPGARRLVRVDSIGGDGWVPVPLAAGGSPATAYGITAYGDGVALVDVANARLVVLDEQGDTVSTTPLSGAEWASPAFVASSGSDLVVADVVTNRLWLLEPQGAGFAPTTSLRGSPPDVVQPLFDSIGGVG